MNHEELPLGFGMALAQNEEAMERFSAMPEEKKQAVLERVHQVDSRQEMHRFVEELGRGE